MGLRDIGATLPPGFRFYPSDEELVCHYLFKKIANEQSLKGTLVEVDLHTCEPWQLPDVAKLNASEWYFFSFRDRKYATGFRTNRATTSGYWKATGKDRTVHDPATREIVGMRKTLVFYRNRAPNGIKTGWIMHEFRLETPHMPPKEDWVLCRVFHRSKAEGSDKLSPPYMFEAPSTTAINIAPSLKSPPNDPTTTMPYHHHQHHSYHATLTSSLSSSSTHHHDHHHNHNSNSLHLLHYPNNVQERNMPPASNMMSDIDSKFVDDDYGFLWDANLEESSICDGVSSNLGREDVRFEMDNSVVFL
ncbi:NAC domain-containing protein 21/22-like [Syzygium oleosum]|uniref:NAC domain-containing protein 21/22-like n=1 Tax=Syzygium oleosum TaxID=219896 RepID=UPI0024BA18F9|nr:NAC domain-containing protein 21/22-like [Syzygium oleosum]